MSVCDRCGRVGVEGVLTIKAVREGVPSLDRPLPLCGGCIAGLLNRLNAPSRPYTERPRRAVV